jgi:transposase
MPGSTLRLPRASSAGRGRPSTLTDATAAAICSGVRRGLSRTSAAALAGVSRATMIEWMARGEGASKRPSDARFAAFAAHVRRAEAEHEAELLETIAASGDARLSLAVLERRHRDDWHLSRRVEATVAHGNSESIRAAIERITAAVAEAEREADGGRAPLGRAHSQA